MVGEGDPQEVIGSGWVEGWALSGVGKRKFLLKFVALKVANSRVGPGGGACLGADDVHDIITSTAPSWWSVPQWVGCWDAGVQPPDTHTRDHLDLCWT